jgi:hypothetical protein
MHQYKVPVTLILLSIFLILLFLNSRKKTSGYSPVDFTLAKQYKEVLLAEYPGQTARLKEIPDDVLYILVNDFNLRETRNYILYKPDEYILLSKKDINSEEVKTVIQKIKDKTGTFIQTEYKDFSPATIQLYKDDMSKIASSSSSAAYIK